MMARVIHDDAVSELFPVTNGVKQEMFYFKVWFGNVKLCTGFLFQFVVFNLSVNGYAFGVGIRLHFLSEHDKQLAFSWLFIHTPTLY